jgi:hypothetical protein
MSERTANLIVIFGSVLTIILVAVFAWRSIFG